MQGSMFTFPAIFSSLQLVYLCHITEQLPSSITPSSLSLECLCFSDSSLDITKHLFPLSRSAQAVPLGYLYNKLVFPHMLVYAFLSMETNSAIGLE